MEKQKLYCDTCGKETDQLRRDALDRNYNALMKPPLWNFEACYQKKWAERLGRRQSR